jgi:type II secretory pathway component HofQ
MNARRTIFGLIVLLTSEVCAQQTDSLRQREFLLPKGARDSTTLSFKDTDLRDILRALAAQHNLNLFIDNAINKRSTISLNNVRVYNAIKFICDQNKLDLQVDAGIIKITPPKVEV